MRLHLLWASAHLLHAPPAPGRDPDRDSAWLRDAVSPTSRHPAFSALCPGTSHCAGDRQTALRLAEELPADETDLWSCSRAFRREIVEWFGARGGELRVIEIGAYRGLTTLVLSHVFASVATIDFNETLLQVARRRNRRRENVRYFLGDTATDRWWEAMGDAEVLLVDGGHTYEVAKRDVASGLEHLKALSWVILDDYGALGEVARVVEEFLSRGDFSHCEALGRRSGDRIPKTGLLFNGPEAVLCAVRPAREKRAVAAAKVFFGDMAEEVDAADSAVFALHGRLFEVCLAPCETYEDMQRLFAGYVNFTELAEHRQGDLVGGLVHFSGYLGGGRGRWRQLHPGKLLAVARYKLQAYYLAFLPNMLAFQANVLTTPDNQVGPVAFKAPQVSPIAPEFFGHGPGGPVLTRATPALPSR